MTRFTLDLLAGAAALAAALSTGYRCWRAHRARAVSGTQPDPGTDPTDPGAFPLAAGVGAGVAILLLGCGTLAAGDRFYSAANAASLLLGVLLGTVIVALGPVCVARLRAALPARTLPPSDTGNPHLSAGWIAHRDMRIAFTLLFIAACVVWPLGIRFGVMGVGAAPRELGGWSLPVTTAWIVVAAAVVQLLTGIAGAAVVVLAAASAAVFHATLSVHEHVLNGLSLVFLCAGVGAAVFHLPPARLPLRASATVFPGFLFAVLTVLARQKTAAALLLVFPLSVVVVLAVGFMVMFLERTVSAVKPGDND